MVIVRTAEIVVDAAAVPVAVVVIVDAAVAVAVPVAAADAIVDAAVRAEEDTRSFATDLHGYEKGHGESRGPLSICLKIGFSLELHHREAGDSLEVPEIAGGYAVAEFQGRHSDQQIRERKANTFGLVLAIDMSSSKSDCNCDRMGGQSHQYS
jgi:hypothetical protein